MLRTISSPISYLWMLSSLVLGILVTCFLWFASSSLLLHRYMLWIFATTHFLLPFEFYNNDIRISNMADRHVLDYDGTLSSIVQDPDSVVMTKEMRDMVGGVAQHFPTAIMSGRCRDKILIWILLGRALAIPFIIDCNKKSRRG